MYENNFKRDHVEMRYADRDLDLFYLSFICDDGCQTKASDLVGRLPVTQAMTLEETLMVAMRLRARGIPISDYDTAFLNDIFKLKVLNAW